MCVVYVERGKLRQALECLQRAHKLAPGESYILKHLNIVKQRIIDLSQAAAMQKQKNEPLNGNIGDTETEGYDVNDPETRYDEYETNATTTDNKKSNEKHVEDTNNSRVDGRTLSTTKNQKHPGDSTISEATNSINPKGIRRHGDPPKKMNEIDAVDAETESKGHTNRRQETHKISHERTSTTQFGHDLDEPSSGTS